MSENTNDREAFEVWAVNNGMHDFTRVSKTSDEYLRDPTHICWLSWQAAIEHKQSISPTETFQLHEIFGSIEECPPILESDSFIVKRVKEMAQLINSLSTNGWVSVPKENQLLENWLNINMPAGTEIGDPKWWAIRIRNVLSCEARIQKSNNTDADTIGLIASREIMDILENGDGHMNRSQLQAKIQCAVINAISHPKGE